MIDEILKTEAALEALGIKKKIDQLHHTEVFSGVRTINGEKPDDTGNITVSIVHNETDPLSLHLDQTVPQEIVNGMPIFTKGLVIKAGERIYFDG